MDFDFRSELIENDRYYHEMAARYNADYEEREIIGECVFCGKEISEQDDEFLFNDDEGTGICHICLGRCRWR